MNLVRKKELIKRIAEKSGVTQEASHKVLDAFSEVVQEALTNNEEVIVVGFGRWSTRTLGAKDYILPDGKKGNVSERKQPTFTFSKPIKEAVRGSAL